MRAAAVNRGEVAQLVRARNHPWGRGFESLSPLPIAVGVPTPEILSTNSTKTRLAPPRPGVTGVSWFGHSGVFRLVTLSVHLLRRDGRYLFRARLPACLSPKNRGQRFGSACVLRTTRLQQLRAARIASWMLSVKVAEDPELALRHSPAFDGYGTSAYDYPKPIRHARFCNSATTAPAREPPRAEPCGRRP